MPDEVDEELRKFLHESLEKMPDIIRSGLLKPETSATNRLKWTGLAAGLLGDPVGRPVTDLDRKNAREAAAILREAVPELEKIRDEHSSERLRKKADHWIKEITAKLGPALFRDSDNTLAYITFGSAGS
jgi:hypothetical protein